MNPFITPGSTNTLRACSVVFVWKSSIGLVIFVIITPILIFG